MADSSNNKPSIFNKMLQAGSAILDAQIHKAKTSVLMNQPSEEEGDIYYAKAITEDPSFAVNSSGWKEKPYRILEGQLKQMSLQDSVVAAVIQTRQNQVSNYSQLVRSEKEKGWMLCFRDEDALLEKIKEDLRESMGLNQSIQKAENELDSQPEISDQDSSAKDAQDDDAVEDYNWELERKAREKLDSEYKEAKKKVQDYLLYCGKVEGKPFDKRDWNFDLALRAMVRDSLTYDKYAIEVVPNKLKKPSYWFPIDASTVKYASEDLKKYKSMVENFVNNDFLYPERKKEAEAKERIIHLDTTLLEKNMYRYVQIIRGKIERAYTKDELKLGIRNKSTDIYNNGYGISELELLVSLVSGHLNAEYYNQAYFTQGFSAKGILHVKAQLSRRKVESVRQQWTHLIRGAKNSFQTPIFAGMDEVKWIPLTQNHDDIGFENWMRYLIKMICSIYQIDPHEIGIGFKDEGGSAGMSGDNTAEKIQNSKDKGLYPLLRHLENFINENLLRQFDERFIIKFCGVTSETPKEALDRQDIERRFKKTLNEIRFEDGLPPLPGGDTLILGPEYLQWYGQFSPEAKENMQSTQSQNLDETNPDESYPEDSLYSQDNFEQTLMNPEEGDSNSPELGKSHSKTKKLKIEYFTIKD